MLGARDMVFPYMNMLSFWFYLLSVIILLASYFVEGWPTGAGWTLSALHTPGHAPDHLCFGLAEENTGAPMLLISGSGPVATMGLGHFQDLDQVAMAAPVTKYARVVDCADRIPQLVHEAFSAALSGRPGQ